VLHLEVGQARGILRPRGFLDQTNARTMNTDSVAARPEGSKPRTHCRNADAVLKQTAQALAGLYGASLVVFTFDLSGQIRLVASQDGTSEDTIPDFPYSSALPNIDRDGSSM